MVNKMRAPAQLIPTGNLRISVATGALVTLGILIAAAGLSVSSYPQVFMMSPFVSGAIAGVVYGGVETKGGGHFFVIGYLSFILLLLLFIFTAAILRQSFFQMANSLYAVAYLFAFLPLTFLIILVPGLLSTVGAMFGWVVALVIRR